MRLTGMSLEEFSHKVFDKFKLHNSNYNFISKTEITVCTKFHNTPPNSGDIQLKTTNVNLIVALRKRSPNVLE